MATTTTTQKATAQDPCLGCGPKGSAAYNQCLAESYMGQGFKMPACASQGTTVVQDATNAVVTNATTNILQPVLAALPIYGVKIGLFMGALMLVIVGFWILTSNPVADTGNALGSGANTLAKNVGTHVGRRFKKAKPVAAKAPTKVGATK